MSDDTTKGMGFVTPQGFLLHRVDEQRGELRRRIVHIGLPQVERLLLEFASKWRPAGPGWSATVERDFDAEHDEWIVTFERLDMEDPTPTPPEPRDADA